MKERDELRYGIPAADQILVNRSYIIGYSYYFRQAKWAIEIVNSKTTNVERIDNFRPDFRIPQIFRADLVDYSGSGYDRGHLIASADQIEKEIYNSDTFLLSNMSPQRPKFNRVIWKKLEGEVRRLANKKSSLATYVICGPVFFFDKPVEKIGEKDKNGVSIPIPHAFFKSILLEDNRGRIKMWSFIIPSEKSTENLEEFLVSVNLVEKIVGIKLWDKLFGDKVEREKKKIRKMW